MGSIGGASEAEARRLVDRALDEGIKVLDTANIYGQGASERIIGRATRSRDAFIITKAGKYVSSRSVALRPLKTGLRKLVRTSPTASARLQKLRSQPMPTRWDRDSLLKSLDGSLRRLSREQVDLFMLHSPSAEVLTTANAVEALESAKRAGKARFVGVSVDDVASAEAAIADERVDVVQLPLNPLRSEMRRYVEQANRVGVAVIAREVLGGQTGLVHHSHDQTGYVAQRLSESLSDRRIAVTLVGVTRLASLHQTLALARPHLDPGGQS